MDNALRRKILEIKKRDKENSKLAAFERNYDKAVAENNLADMRKYAWVLQKLGADCDLSLNDYR